MTLEKQLNKLWVIGNTGPLWFCFRACLADRHHYVYGCIQYCL